MSPDEMPRTELLLVLGLKHDFTKDELKQAYSKKVKQLHPDNGGDTAFFVSFLNAYENLRAAVTKSLVIRHVVYTNDKQLSKIRGRVTDLYFDGIQLLVRIPKSTKIGDTIRVSGITPNTTIILTFKEHHE